MKKRADRLLKRSTLIDNQRAEVQQMKDRAVREEKAKVLLPQIVASAAAAQMDATLQLYRQLPADSYYQAAAKTAAQPMINQYFELQLRRATEARSESHCGDAQAALDGILSLDPAQPAALAAKQLPCPTPRTRKDRADKPKSR